MLIVGIEPKSTLKSLGVVAHKISDSKDSFREIASQLLSEKQIPLCWYPESEVIGSVHDLFNEAYKNIQQGIIFNETIIGTLLLNALPVCEEIVLWYSNDFFNLPCVENAKDFMSIIASDLMLDSGEMYLRFNASCSSPVTNFDR